MNYLRWWIVEGKISDFVGLNYKFYVFLLLKIQDKFCVYLFLFGFLKYLIESMPMIFSPLFCYV